jgi:serine/threonine protein kinase
MEAEQNERPPLAGRYELGESLGVGGMGEVRAAHDTVLNRQVAIKILRIDLSSLERMRARFEAEARAAAKISHPNVVSIYDVGTDGELSFIVMEKLPGRHLGDEIADGPLEPARVIQIAQEVLAALQAAHRVGVIHRDIKPGNILLAEDGSVKVTDFGIAKVADLNLTRTGELFGTLCYMAPELLEGIAATPKSDLYAAGVVLYEALTGEKPFDADTPAAILLAIHRGRWTPLGKRLPELDPGFAGAIDRSMSADPSRRYNSAQEMAAALGKASVPAHFARAQKDRTTTIGELDRTDVLEVPPSRGLGHLGDRIRRGWLLKRIPKNVGRAAILALALVLLVTIQFVLRESPTAPQPPKAVPSPTTIILPPGVPPGLGDALEELNRAVRP